MVPGAEIVIVGPGEDPQIVRQAFQAGARDYISRSSVTTDLLPAIAKLTRDGLPRDPGAVLFRTIQECLTNVHRHSVSPNAQVRISRSQWGRVRRNHVRLGSSGFIESAPERPAHLHFLTRARFR